MDRQKKLSPKNQPQNFKHIENDVSHESFRQNPYFAEKILPHESIFPPTCDEYDIKKITRKKLETMIYAKYLNPVSPDVPPSIEPLGINRWIWNNKISEDINPDILKEFLLISLKNSPLVFYRKYRFIVELLHTLVKFHKIPFFNLTNEHILNQPTLQYLIDCFATSPPKRQIVQFIENKMILAGLIETKTALPQPKRISKQTHPKVREYQKHLKKRGITHEHLRHCLASINELLYWLSESIQDFHSILPTDIPIIRISNSHLLAYRSYKLKLVKEGNCSPITFSYAISNIRSFFLFLKDRFGFPAPLQSFRAIKAPRYKSRKIPTTQQLDRFFEVINTYSVSPCHDRVAYGLLLYLGLRLSEASRVTWSDINFGNKTIAIHSKGGKKHLLPLAGVLYKSICELKEKYAANCHFLLGDNQQSIAYRIYQNYKLYALIAGWSFPGGVHFFRHIFVTRLAYQGILPQVMKELTRVQNLDTVSLYLHMTQQSNHLTDQINMLTYD